MTSRIIELSRQIAAPPAKVWRCWTDPALLPQWFGPKGFTCKTTEIDLREGGLWRFDMIGPDGTVWKNRHRYLRMEPTHLLQFLLDGDDDGEAAAEVEMTLSATPGGTLIRYQMQFPTAEACQAALGFGAKELGQTTLDKLADLAEGLPPA